MKFTKTLSILQPLNEHSRNHIGILVQFSSKYFIEIIRDEMLKFHNWNRYAQPNVFMFQSIPDPIMLKCWARTAWLSFDRSTYIRSLHNFVSAVVRLSIEKNV